MSATRLPLTEAELDRLEGMLASDVFGQHAMPLDAMQGFMAAVVSAPDLILPSRWLPVALGGEGDWESVEAARGALELLMRLYNEIALDLFEGHGIDPMLYPLDESSEELDYAMWALGYLEGVDLAEPAWDVSGDPDEVEDLLFPFMILAGGLEHDPVLRESLALKETEQAELLASCREDLAATVQDAYDYWLEKRRPQTVRRETPKIGRNDPCICGSGKKFKQCCGAPHTEH
jgi:uncharacterized protein